MNQDVYLDITKIEPQLKHPTIFNVFDALKENESVLLHNDHDPKPLYYQLLGERGNCFTWTYLSKGPDIWEVEIKKDALKNENETIGQIVAKDMRKAEVFKRAGIDFCCGGKKTIEEACAEKGLDTLRIKEELEQYNSANVSPQHDFNDWNLSFLSDYIVNVHHAYIHKNAPLLKEMSEKVAGQHGKTNPELGIIRDKVDELVAQLNAHMKKEEKVLFPFIKQIESGIQNERLKGFTSVMQPISIMEHDHDIVGDLLVEISETANGYATPQNACNSFKFLYHKLKEFEDDLHMHIHLENNILFPRAFALEARLN